MITNIVKTREALYRGRNKALQMLTACGLIVGACGMQSCEKDILTGQPSWLGNSIYERLEEGINVDGQDMQFKTTLRLIDDLGYKTTLSMTGSKTIFVASDKAYEKWFANNSWGVTRYEDLTLQQKKQLFNGSMINNAYLIELMSSTPATSATTDPEKGMCMRREASTSIWDNVPQMKVGDFPQNEALTDDPINEAWRDLRERGNDIFVLTDATSAPMIHFLPAFMEKNNITDEDLVKVSNGESNSNKDSWINGKKVISQEQTCKNGYVYVIDGVMESNPNMAEIIHNNPQTKIWSKLLRRFCVPETMNKATQDEFWRLYPDNAGDSIYNIRYLNESVNHPLTRLPNSTTDLNQTLLKFDPGWNQYVADGLQMQNDAAVMVVPTDDQLNEWFSTGGEGQALYQKFNGSWDAIDLQTLAKFINVNMFGSFVSSVPSKFNSMLDDAQRPFNMKPEDVKQTIMGCNGVVYLTNKVFTPSEYSSVLYPALIEGDFKSGGTFSTIYKALQGRAKGGSTSDYDTDFTPYLSAMDSRFSLIIPYNVAPTVNPNGKETNVIRFIDPCSYGLAKQYMYEFYTATTGAIAAWAYPCTIAADGTVSISTTDMILRKQVDENVVANRLFDYIDNATIVEDIVADKKYYRTKAGSIIFAENNGSAATFKGGYQMETGEKITTDINHIFTMQNGTTFGIAADAEDDVHHINIPLTASKSLYQMLKEEKDKGGDHLFFDLIFEQPSQVTEQKPLFSSRSSNYYCANTASNYNITLFDNYNYTVYVPSDAEIQKLQENGQLPTWKDYEANVDDAELRQEIANRIHSFIRYHVQDNSIFVDGGSQQTGLYESAKMNADTRRFFTYEVESTPGRLVITDNIGQKHEVIADKSNKPCREMWIKPGGSATTSVTTVNAYQSTIESSSYIVIHKIEKPLIYDNSQLTDWTKGEKIK